MFNSYQNLGTPMSREEMMATKGGMAEQEHDRVYWDCDIDVCQPASLDPTTWGCATNCTSTGIPCGNASCA